MTTTNNGLNKNPADFLHNLNNNNIFLGELPQIINSRINFVGKNNILFCDKNVTLKNCDINFLADNSLIYINSGTATFVSNIYNNSVLYIGKYNFFNPAEQRLYIQLSEEKNIFIGNNNYFSTNSWIRNADAHLIYDIETKSRINYSKSIYIGDHIWFGQDCGILKGAKIHSGSIIGAKSLITSKLIPSNTCWGGAPANLIRKNTFWDGKCIHSWTSEKIKQESVLDIEDYIFTQTEDSIDFSFLEEHLAKLNTPHEKLEFLNNLSTAKNRFAKY